MSKRTKFLLGIGVIAALVIGFQVVAFATLPGSDFQGGDGNLIDDGAGIDWNSFDPVQWTGTAPNRLASENPTDKTDPLADGWQFVGKEDGEKNADTSGFAGGTKQDKNCPSVISTSSPNKDDLKRAYLSTKVIGGDTFLNLAWVRTKQNNTSASAHVGFEFNQGEVACASGGLVNRLEDDLLIVYDFEGSAGDPVISLRKWVTDPAGTCEVGSNEPPCWGEADTLTAGEAEAKVNGPLTNIGPVLDALSPPGPPATGPGASDDETLGVSEFGEASINLSDALPDVFGPGTCNTFGKAEVISRSSGNSEQAAMMDLVGPVNFTLSNCGQVHIIKQTSPAGLNQDFDYTSSNSALSGTCKIGTTDVTSPVSSFKLNDNADATDSLDCTDVPAGTYTVTEGADPTGFTFTDLSCTASGTGTSATPTSGNSTRTASITIAGGGSVTCTYTNTQQLGAIKITKTAKDAGTTAENDPLPGAKFSIKGPDGNALSGSPFTTDANGVICKDNLPFGSYKVQETEAPTGYQIDDATEKTVVVDNNASCNDTTYGGESIAFTDTPLSSIQVKFTSLAGAGKTVSSIDCAEGANALTPTPNDTTPTVFDDTDETYTGLLPGTTATPKVYTCTIKVDP